MLEAIVTHDRTFALASLNLASMSLEEERGNMDEAAVKWQKAIGKLKKDPLRCSKSSAPIVL